MNGTSAIMDQNSTEILFGKFSMMQQRLGHPQIFSSLSSNKSYLFILVCNAIADVLKILIAGSTGEEWTKV